MSYNTFIQNHHKLRAYDTQQSQSEMKYESVACIPSHNTVTTWRVYILNNILITDGDILFFSSKQHNLPYSSLWNAFVASKKCISLDEGHGQQTKRNFQKWNHKYNTRTATYKLEEVYGSKNSQLDIDIFKDNCPGSDDSVCTTKGG